MIGIVGGGISGLFLLHLLRERGVDAVVLEASEIPGGVMRSVRVEGPVGPVTVDLGPQRARLTSSLAEIFDAAGLTPALVRAAEGVPFTIHRQGRLHPAPMSFRQALTTPLISWRGKLRALRDPFTSAPRPDESVAHALTRKLGPEIYRRLAGPLLGGLYASDPGDMEARHTLLPALGRTGSQRSLLLALQRAARLDQVPVVSFQGGMGALPTGLARRHRDRVRLNTPVQAIEPAPGEGYDLVLGEESVRVREVVLTLPAPEGACLLHGFAPRAAEAMGALRYNPLAVVPLIVPQGQPGLEVGSGFKMTLDDPYATRGVTAHEALFGRKGLFTAFLGGMGREEVVERPDEEILAIAREDFRRITGADPVPLLVHRTRMPAWDRSWRAMDGLELPPGIHLCAAFAHRPGIAGRLEDARRVADRIASVSR